MSATFEDLNIVISTQIGNNATRAVLSLEELIVQMRASGATEQIIRQTILNDLMGAGRLFGAFRNGIKNISRNAILSAGNIATMQTYQKAGISEYKWITLGMTGSCPDCNDRHGEQGDMEYFETIGLPKSGFSVCGGNCQCQLVPINYKGKGLDKPILRRKK